MVSATGLRSADAFRSAFRVEPEVAKETGRARGLGIYGWKTPAMDGFELPETDELIVALHLGGSRRVRAITARGLSPACSTPGLLTVLPPGRASAFRTEGSISLVSLHIARPAAATRTEGYLRRLAHSTSSRFAFRDPFVSAGMETLLRTAGSENALDPAYFATVTDALLCHLAQANPVPNPEPRAESGPMLGKIPLAELLAFIEARLGDKLGLLELARMTGLGRAAFTRGFRSAVGQSPHQFVNQRRVIAAEALLRETGLDLAFIAQETGFSSQSHFTSIFRNRTGCTPGNFRSGH